MTSSNAAIPGLGLADFGYVTDHCPPTYWPLPPHYPMYLERCLQISMAAFAAMGTVLLGMGEDSVALPLAAIVVSCLSVWITDIKGWLRLNRLTADLAGVAAMAASIWQWQGDWSEGQLLALGQFCRLRAIRAAVQAEDHALVLAVGPVERVASGRGDGLEREPRIRPAHGRLHVRGSADHDAVLLASRMWPLSLGGDRSRGCRGGAVGD